MTEHARRPSEPRAADTAWSTAPPAAGERPARRRFMTGTAAMAASAVAACGSTPPPSPSAPPVAGPRQPLRGAEHFAFKSTPDGRVRLFLWNKRPAPGTTPRGTIVFVHGSSVQSTPAFDLQVRGRDDTSVMDNYARLGFDTWCFDCEGYGRSDKYRNVNADIRTGADDTEVVIEEIARITGARKVLLYGSSSGALRAAVYAERRPDRVQRLALDAFVWTGEGSPTLAERAKRLPQYRAANRRPIDREFVRSIFTRDKAGTSDPQIVEAFADAVLALDDSMPTGTYVDMTANLPVCDPKRITVPTLIMRGQWDGIATIEDLNRFFMALPNADKQFIVMPGIAHTSLRSKNYQLVYHLLTAFLTQPEPVYVG